MSAGTLTFGALGVISKNEDGWIVIPWMSVICVDCRKTVGAYDESTITVFYENGYSSMTFATSKQEEVLGKALKGMAG